MQKYITEATFGWPSVKNATVRELKGSLLSMAKILQYDDCVAYKTIIDNYKLEQRPSMLSSIQPTLALLR